MNTELDFTDSDVCRCCGCRDDEACEGGCWWIEPNLCSNCQEHPWGGQETTQPSSCDDPAECDDPACYSFGITRA